jgi:formylglycine-generating enzyme required for sulfatase activity
MSISRHELTPMAWGGLLGLAIVGAASAQESAFSAQREEMLIQIQSERHLSGPQMDALRNIFAGSRFIGQGNPRIAEHPISSQECQNKIHDSGIQYENPEFERICGAKYMAPLYDPERQSPQDAKVCIDQFEFPNIPCTYPVVWVRAREAAEICEAIGERLCDAHEWEGACAGQLLPPDYRFDLAEGVSPSAAVERMRAAHNRAYEGQKSWSYGPNYQAGTCAAASQKSPGCQGGGWEKCGSNTYPSGSFPGCHSSLGVYDLNGNAAEHMNLPLNSSEMASEGSKVLGYTEMKGSWFIFDRYRAHPDWCRWRAPYWHGSRVMDAGSHSNYHLGFRCCKSLDKERVNN